MTNESRQDETEKDAYPPDAQFGRAAAEDAERADIGAGEVERDDVRPGNKAEPPGEESGREHSGSEDSEAVDEDSKESFPASDPPSNW